MQLGGSDLAISQQSPAVLIVLLKFFLIPARLLIEITFLNVTAEQQMFKFRRDCKFFPQKASRLSNSELELELMHQQNGPPESGYKKCSRSKTNASYIGKLGANHGRTSTGE
jgi:hypothetical protein